MGSRRGLFPGWSKTLRRDRNRETAVAGLRVMLGQGFWAWLALGLAVRPWAVELLHPHRQSTAPTRDSQSDASLILLSGGFWLSTHPCLRLSGSFVNRKTHVAVERAQASCRLGGGSSRLISVGWQKSIERKVHFHNVSFGWRQGKWGERLTYFSRVSPELIRLF